MNVGEFSRLLRSHGRDEFYTLAWKSVIQAIAGAKPCDELRALFHTEWVTHGEEIRQQVSDDVKLARVLRAWLPPYAGGTVTLYRGENAARFEARRVGLCWTQLRHVAESFASVQNAMGPGGGVLLAADVPAEAVIAGPASHSGYLGEDEYTVDASMLESITVVARYPRVRD